jgi:hypothetical protein
MRTRNRGDEQQSATSNPFDLSAPFGPGHLAGLAAGGVDRALGLLRAELRLDCALLGVDRVTDIGPRHVQRAARMRLEYLADRAGLTD